MRKYFTGLIVAVFAMTAILPLRVLAAGDEVRLKEEGNNVNVSVSVSGGAGEKAASLQLGLQITDQDGNPVGPDLLEQIENLTFSWSQEVQASAAITEQRYQKETGILRIYVAGTEPLFSEDGEAPDSLALGTVMLTELAGVHAGSGLYISVAPGSFRMVQGRNAVQLAAAAPDAVPIIPVNQEESTDPSDPETPEPEQPGNSGGGTGGSAGTTRPQVDKSQLQEVLDLAAGYQEADYTSESFGVLKQAMKEGQAVLDDPYAVQEEVDQAAAAIRNAIGGLVPFGTTSIEERSAMYAGTSQAVGTGDRLSWYAYAAMILFGGSVIAGGFIWKTYWKRITDNRFLKCVRQNTEKGAIIKETAEDGTP